MENRFAKHNDGISTMRIKLMDVLVMLYALHRADSVPALHNIDADQTVEELSALLNKSVLVNKKTIESGLACVNMLNELGLYYHPQGRSFATMLDRMFRGSRNYTFNRSYNLIMEKNNETD